MNLGREFSGQASDKPQRRTAAIEYVGALCATLFDLEADPNEMRNLAEDDTDLMVAMNDKLNNLIESEVGEDAGQMMPDDSESNWTLDPSVSTIRM